MTNDLYRYDFEAPAGDRLTLVSVGDASAATPGAGADVRGVVRVSPDGGRAYVVAGGVLTTAPNGRGQAAVAGENNLYRVDAGGAVRFVATLDPYGDGQVYASVDTRPAQLADAAGRCLVFTSIAPLTPDDTDTSADVYRYDAEAGSLERVSVGHAGFGSDGNAEAPVRIRTVDNGYSLAAPMAGSRVVSGDGQRIVFATNEALQADDVNDAPDIYEWHDDDVALISNGTDPYGVGGEYSVNGWYAMSADGSSVAFSSAQRLLPDRDVDTADDVYVARLGADVDPLPPGPAPPCGGEACQGGVVPLPDVRVPRTPLFDAPGNVVPPPVDRSSAVKVAKPRVVRGLRATLRVTVWGRGRVLAAGSGVRSTSRAVGKSGTYAVRVSLSAKARKALRRTGSVRAKVRVTFRPAVGQSSSRSVSVTFKSSSSKKGRS